jgi:hypothetical protein
MFVGFSLRDSFGEAKTLRREARLSLPDGLFEVLKKGLQTSRLNRLEKLD